MKKIFLILIFILITNNLFAETSQISGKLKTNKKSFLYNEPIEFTYVFNSPSKHIFNINTPIFGNTASFGIGIIIKNKQNQYYKFIRTPFWHYMMTRCQIDFSKSKEITIKYIHNPKNDHCRIIDKYVWVDNSPSITLKNQEEFKKGNEAFKNASSNIPPGEYTAWFEVTLSEIEKIDLTKVDLNDIQIVAENTQLKKFLVKSQPIEFVVLKKVNN